MPSRNRLKTNTCQSAKMLRANRRLQHSMLRKPRLRQLQLQSCSEVTDGGRLDVVTSSLSHDESKLQGPCSGEQLGLARGLF